MESILGVADSFRELRAVNAPDPRMTSRMVFDPDTGEPRPMTIRDLHRHLSTMELYEKVPHEIQRHFDRTRNLALYSWFVYGFIPVADWHACASLELALKVRSGLKDMGLRKLIRHAICQGWVANEGFSQWNEMKATFEYELQKQEQLHEAMGIPFDPPSTGGFRWDYVSILLESLPMMRNAYAHGSAMLYPGTVNLRVVAEFINQLFPN